MTSIRDFFNSLRKWALTPVYIMPKWYRDWANKSLDEESKAAAKVIYFQAILLRNFQEQNSIMSTALGEIKEHTSEALKVHPLTAASTYNEIATKTLDAVEKLKGEANIWKARS